MFREGERISGFAMKYTDEVGAGIVSLGYGTRDNKDFLFVPTKRIMGVYGSQTNEYITELGFILMD